MRLIKLTVENFRCYPMPFSISFENLTAIVGQNDVGKSALMDALAIFFEQSKLEADDACKLGNPEQVRITCEFDQLPDELIVDTDHPTTLKGEYLLSDEDTLIIRKSYDGSLGTPKLKAIEALANHPTTQGRSDLLLLKNTDLKKRADQLGVNLEGVNKTKNAPIRAAIWAAADALELSPSEITLDKEGAKQVYTALSPWLPAFALFKSDRASTDQDAEAQDPLKLAIQEALKAVEQQLQKIKEHVEAEVKKIGEATVEKLREMDPSIAETLNPVITTKKWDSLFQTSITGDQGIPLNKRGSGVKRLVLLNFFRAKVERDAKKNKNTSIIYAIEEPETSQHPRNQRLLLSALRELSADDDRQVILTTHTPMLVRYISNDSIRFLQKAENGTRTMQIGSEQTNGEIAKSLGVLADHNVKVFVAVEGPNDIEFLKAISKMLVAAGEPVPDLEALEIAGELIFVTLGGGNLAIWTSRLKDLNRPEYHIYDRDNPPPENPKYAAAMAQVNARDGCTAVSTAKREMENYLHYEAVQEAYAANNINIRLVEFEPVDDVPQRVAEAVHAASNGTAWNTLSEKDQKQKVSRAKRHLNCSAARRMTKERLAAVDAQDEITGWLISIGQMMQQD